MLVCSSINVSYSLLPVFASEASLRHLGFCWRGRCRRCRRCRRGGRRWQHRWHCRTFEAMPESPIALLVRCLVDQASVASKLYKHRPEKSVERYHPSIFRNLCQNDIFLGHVDFTLLYDLTGWKKDYGIFYYTASFFLHG